MRPVIHASLTQAMVNHLVAATAAEQHIGFKDARQLLANRWTEEARHRVAHNMSTYRMWQEMAEMARRAEP